MLTEGSYGGNPGAVGQTPVGMGGGNANEEIRTIFLTGLAEDVTPRELHLMFLRDQDYEGCVLKQMGRQMVAFISFKTQESALHAINGVQGLKFDPNSDRPIRAELAKANSKIKRQRVGGEGGPPQLAGNPHKRPFDGSQMGGPPPMDPQFGGAPYGVPHDPYYGAPPQPSMWPHTSTPGMGGAIGQPYMPHMAPMGGVDAGFGGAPKPRSARPANPPCNTLFVVNFGMATSEADLVAVFQQYTGYQRMKLTAKGTCFVNFSDVESASACRDAVQGTVLPTCDRGGLRIEFAKSAMGASRPNE